MPGLAHLRKHHYTSVPNTTSNRQKDNNQTKNDEKYKDGERDYFINLLAWRTRLEQNASIRFQNFAICNNEK